MKDTFYRSMNWLHTWAGLLVCWVLLLVFFAGTLSFFRHEISLYTKPELHHGVIGSGIGQDPALLLEQGQAYLASHHPSAQDWYIDLPTQRQPYLAYGWAEKREGQKRARPQSQPITLDGELADKPRDSLGGNFFYRLHFDLHYLPVAFARYLVGICTMFMLIALISGIIIHKRIFKDFFSFRPGKGSRSWLDAHNLSSVFALPFHLVITYTGLITLMFMYMPWAGQSVWQGDTDAMFDELFVRYEHSADGGDRAPMLSIASLLPQVQAHWGQNMKLKGVSVKHPGKANASVSFTRLTGNTLTDEREQLVFSAIDGTLLHQTPTRVSTTLASHDTLMALHTARFAGPLLRSLGFLMGLMGCVMIASGCLLWAKRLREKGKQGSGLKLVEGLNLTMIAGLPLATLVFFHANRLLPTALPNRAQWEVHAFFIALGCCALMALMRRDALAWRALLGVAGVLALAMPLVNALTSPAHLLTNLGSGQWSLALADGLFLLTALACFFGARKLPKGVPATGKRLQEQTA